MRASDQQSARDPEQIPLITYHHVNPFGPGEGRLGFSQKLEAALNRFTPSHIRFVLEFVPRRRLNRYLEEDKLIVVPWVYPAWFQDQAQEKFLWTRPLFRDQDVIVMHPEAQWRRDGGQQTLAGCGHGKGGSLLPERD